MPESPGGDGLGPAAAAFNLPPAFLGEISVGRDLRALTVVGDLNVGRSRLNIGRDAKLIHVAGNIDSSEGGSIQVGRILTRLQVDRDWTGDAADAVDSGDVPVEPRGVDLLVGQTANVIHVGGSLIRAGFFIFETPTEGGEPGPEAPALPAAAATSMATRLGSLEVVKGMQESFVTADIIGALVIGPGAGGAIVQSQIWATQRIDSAAVVGDIVDSRILASPVELEDFGNGPVALAKRVLPRTEEIAIVVQVGNQLFTGVLVRSIVALQLSTAIPSAASIGTSHSSFQLLGSLIDSALAANAPVPDVSPTPPHPLAQPTAPLPGPSAAAVGSIFFELANGFEALETPDGNHPTGLFATTIHARPSDARVLPRI
jgi:hypothetical protein